MAESVASCSNDETTAIDWKKEAALKQSFYGELLGNRTWETYKKNEIKYLYLKLGFALFGPPPAVDENFNELEMFYTDKNEKKSIIKLANIIEKYCNSETISVAFLFVIAQIEKGNNFAEFPVVRILTGQDKEGKDLYKFLDASGRVYSTWNNFLKDNKFPKCYYCYPKDGYYTFNENGGVDIEYGISPEGTLLSKSTKVLDVTSTVAGLGCSLFAAAALLTPMSVPVVTGLAATGVSTGVWSTLRAGLALFDRHKHGQTVSPTESVSRFQWINLVSGILGSASMGALKYTHFLARNGRLLSGMPMAFLNAIEVGNIGVGGLGVLNQFWHLGEKIKLGNLEIIDLSQTALLVLFFFHSTMNFKTLKQVVAEVQKDSFSRIKCLMTKKRGQCLANGFSGSINVTDENTLSRNARVIKSIRYIKNKIDFFHEVLFIVSKTKSLLSYNKKDSNNTERNVPVDDDVCSSVIVRKESWFDHLKNSKFRLPCKQTLEKCLHNFVKAEKINPNSQEITNKVCEILKVGRIEEFKINGESILKNLENSDMNSLCWKLKCLKRREGKNFDERMKTIKTMSESIHCNNYKDFIEIMDSIIRELPLGCIENSEDEERLEEVFKYFCTRQIDIDSDPFTGWDYFVYYALIFFDSVEEKDVSIRKNPEGWIVRFHTPNSGICSIHFTIDIVVENIEYFEVTLYKKLDFSRNDIVSREDLMEHKFFRCTDNNASKKTLTPWNYFEMYVKTYFDPVLEKDVTIVKKVTGWELSFKRVNKGVQKINIVVYKVEEDLEMIEVDYLKRNGGWYLA